jgi:uncharacterized cupin superfamily protein
MPKIDIANVKTEISTGYPAPYRDAVAGRERKRLGNVVGLDQFGVNLMRLKPGFQSSQRHWHEREDEFVFILEGEVVLCENDGETVLKAGDAAAWKAGVANGHCLVNRSPKDAILLEVARARSATAPPIRTSTCATKRTKAACTTCTSRAIPIPKRDDATESADGLAASSPPLTGELRSEREDR